MRAQQSDTPHPFCSSRAVNALGSVTTPLMRFLWRCGRARTVSGLICWLGVGIIDLMLLARLRPLDGTVMVAEMLGLICLVHQRLELAFPSFVSCGLRWSDCLRCLVLMEQV